MGESWGKSVLRMVETTSADGGNLEKSRKTIAANGIIL